MGGPQIPNHSEGFFKNHPYVDIIVHGEGELVLSNIFREYLNEKNFLQIKGIETKDFKNEPEDRIKDLIAALFKGKKIFSNSFLFCKLIDSFP